MKLSFRVDDGVVLNVIEFLRHKREVLKSYSRRLPEVKCVEVLLSKGFSHEDIVRYVVFVSVNDWNLVGLRGGASTLWEVSMRKFIKGFRNFEELAYKVVEALPGLRKSRKREIIDTSKSLDAMTRELQTLIDQIVHQGEIRIDDIRGFILRLRNLSNIRIPLDKVLNLMARVLHFVLDKKIVGDVSIMYDVHVAKVSLRLGVVNVHVDDMDIAAISLFNNKLRKIITDAWNQIAWSIGLTPWHIDAFLWFIGRDFCLFDDEVGRLSISEPSCPAKRCGKECPLNTICKAVEDSLRMAIFSAKIAGSEVVVVYGISKHINP